MRKEDRIMTLVKYIIDPWYIPLEFDVHMFSESFFFSPSPSIFFVLFVFISTHNIRGYNTRYSRTSVPYLIRGTSTKPAKVTRCGIFFLSEVPSMYLGNDHDEQLRTLLVIRYIKSTRRNFKLA